MVMDTISRIKRYLMPKVKMILNERGGEGEGEGEGGGQSTNWKETILPEDMRQDPIFEKYEQPADAFKALVEAQKFLGREKLPVPSGVEDKATYDLIFKRLGLPENEQGYKLPTDLEIPKDLPMDENMINEFKKVAHESRLLPEQFTGLYKWYMKYGADAFGKSKEAQVTATKEAEVELRKEWGAAYQQNVTLAGKVFNTFAGEKEWELFDKKYGNDPALIRMFANMGKILSEDQLTGKPKDLGMTPDEAQAEINKIRGDLTGPLYNESHPQHKEFVDKVDRLTKLTLVGQ